MFDLGCDIPEFKSRNRRDFQQPTRKMNETTMNETYVECDFPGIPWILMIITVLMALSAGCLFLFECGSASAQPHSAIDEMLQHIIVLIGFFVVNFAFFSGMYTAIDVLS